MQLVPRKLDYAPDLRKEKVLRLFTSNSYINVKGELVMGRGAAQQVRMFYGENLAAWFGAQIQNMGAEKGCYGLIINTQHNIGALQVKYHFARNAETGLVGTSLMMLRSWLQDPANAGWEVHMNYPGIGYGGLPKQDIEPWLTPLPDNVFVYEFK